jgi:hypothetical protein
MLSGLQQEAALYALLLRRTERSGFRRILHQIARHTACIKGMYLLSGSSPEAYSPSPPKPAATAALLRRAYGLTLARLTAFEAHAGDSGFGPVFRLLAEETRHSLRLLTEVCGGMQERQSL